MKFSKTTLSTLSATVLGFLALGIASTPASAANTSTTFTVSATVQATCVIAAGNLAFGTYTGAALPATSTITVTCTNTTPYNVLLNPGATTGALVTTRQMKNGANLLNYSLFSNAGLTANWGQTIGTDTVAGTGSGATQTLTVYGNVPASQYVVPGSYTDTVTATISY